MPIYEYECEKCGELIEIVQRFSDNPLTTCQKCSGKLNKLVSHSSFHLKGTGWYVTDYANKSQHSPSCVKKDEKKTTPEPKNTKTATNSNT